VRHPCCQTPAPPPIVMYDQVDYRRHPQRSAMHENTRKRFSFVKSVLRLSPSKDRVHNGIFGNIFNFTHLRGSPTMCNAKSVVRSVEPKQAARAILQLHIQTAASSSCIIILRPSQCSFPYNAAVQLCHKTGNPWLRHGYHAAEGISIVIHGSRSAPQCPLIGRLS
jgi:hypothetical protein